MGTVSSVTPALSLVAGTCTSTNTGRSTVVHTVPSGWDVSTNHWTPLIWISPLETVNPAGRSTPQTSTVGGSPQA